MGTHAQAARFCAGSAGGGYKVRNVELYHQQAGGQLVCLDASNWQVGPGGFGRTSNPTAVVKTAWTSDDIWLRREVALGGSDLDDILGWMNHDDDAEVYINGVLVIRAPGATPSYEDFSFNLRGRRAFRPGKNLIAIHCRNTGGDQYIDFGFVKSKAN